MSKYCTNCGKMNEDSDVFCTGCGSRLPQPSGQSDFAGNPAGASGNQNTAVIKQGGKKKIWIIAGCVLAAAVILIAGYFLFRPQSATSTQSQSASSSDMTSYSLAPGTYSGTQKVLINQPAGANDKIFYTTDGSDPTEQSIAYKDGTEITVDQNMTIRSIAVDSAGNISKVSTGTYKINNPTDTGNSSSASASPSAGQSRSSSSTGSSGIPTYHTTYSNWSYASPQTDLYVTATSTLPDDGSLTYVASNLIDNNSKTAWTEGVSGTGVGESVTFTYTGNGPETVSGFNFLDGYCKNQDIFDQNCTPTQLLVTVNGSDLCVINLYNSPTSQQVNLNQNIVLNNGDTVKFTIQSVIIGPDDDTFDTNISEIRFI